MEGVSAEGAAPKQLFFEGDLVRGAQQGAPGPFCLALIGDLVGNVPGKQIALRCILKAPASGK